MTLRLAVATEDLASSLKKALGVATEFQVQGVRLNARSELDAANTSASALRQTLLYVRERRMDVAGLICPTRHSLCDAEYLEERLGLIRKSMSIVRQLDTSELLIRCGRIPDPDAATPSPPAQELSINEQANPFALGSTTARSAPSPAAEFSLLCEILNDLTRYGNHVGCTLNLQLSSYDAASLARLLAEVKSGPLSICFDPATAIMTGADVVRTYRDLYQHVGYIRARDALRDVDGAGVEVVAGDGVVDWIQFLPTIAEADFRGWICVERTGGEIRRDDVSRGVSYLKSLIPRTGD